MHIPDHFAEKDHRALADFVRAHPFAALLVNGADGPVAAHVPLAPECAPDGRLATLSGHVARANPFWKAALGAPHALAIFAGPEAYVSPGYYPSKGEHGRVVPTWNYVRVEARGTISLVDDAADLREIVDRLTAMMEQPRAAPWSVADAPEPYVAAMLKGIVGVRIAVTSVEGAWKMSQNKSAADRAGVADGLGADGQEEAARLVAARTPPP